MNNTSSARNIKRAASIKDVALRANVSIATVSNVLNGTKAVSEPLRVRVLSAVEELDYKANPLGKSLKKGRTNSIAMIIPSITSIFFPPLIKSLQQNAETNDFSMLLFGSSGDLKKEKKCVEEAVSHGVDGIFISSCANPSDPKAGPYIDYLCNLKNGNRKIQIICMESALSPYLNAVEANDREGTIQAVEHLLSIGRKNIAYIASPQNYQMGNARKKGYLEALRARGISSDPRYITEGDYSALSGYECMQTLLGSDIPIDAVACGNDQMAIGAMRAIKEAGLSIPGDIAVMGYNDNAPSSLVSPALSTMHVPKTEMGAESFRLFQRSLDDPEAAPLHVRLTTELIIRGSTDPDAGASWDLTGW